MKRHAAQGRGDRDARELAVLIAHCDVTAAAEAETLYEAYYPGDAFTPPTTQLVNQILSATAPTPAIPPLPDLA